MIKEVLQVVFGVLLLGALTVGAVCATFAGLVPKDYRDILTEEKEKSNDTTGSV